jgi:transcriptional regulator with GAF, ATPase, and Fis domain
MLRNAGMGQERIAELAGVPIHVLRSLNYSDSGRPPVQRLRAASANAILNVLPDPALLLRRDPRGTQRRLQALAVRGWSLASQARMLGMPQQGVHALMSVKWVTPETADRVRALFEDLWDVDPPGVTPADRQSSAYAKRVARKHGWFPPLAWDDIDTDEQPHRPNPTNRQAGNVAERAEQVRELHRLRWSDRHIAAELEINERTVVRIRQRLGLPGWTKNQQEAA